MFGADIEFFCKDASNKPFPICGKVGGTKDAAIKIDDIFSILEDGAAVELNYTPTDDPYDWLQQVLKSAEVIERFTKFKVHDQPEAKLLNLKNYPQAMEIGCMPDFSAYSDNPEVPREIPDIKEFGIYRYAGGHIHFSYGTKDKIPAYAVARMMDYYVAIPFISAVWNDYGAQVAQKVLGAKRRKHYGLAGLHRPKPYGVEYRVFSNYFALNPKVGQYLPHHLESLAYLLRDEGLDFLNTQYMEINWEEVQKAINNLEWDKLRKISKEIKYS